tara:strand:+ start:11937 stop:13724 length:1788 start_codon:yes stop_codon:yes gene_type:complete
MKLWEKVNNITGNDTKARFLVEYVNAGAKFILASLPEKFLWTIASEVEVNGFDTAGSSVIGSGSSLAYDKILAVYRFDSGKKRIAQEAPDNSIHIFDEASSLLTATEMFPKYYKLSGKIYIKPDPDYNAHKGSGNAFQHAYTNLDGATVTVDSEQGDKGVIVYSAPPIIDENTDDWILTEYENIAILYACSLDYMRLSAYYRGLCKTEIDKIFSTTIESFSSTLPSNYPVFNFSENVPSKFNLSKTIPQFVFNKDLPTNVSLTKSLPNSISITNPLPSAINVSKSLGSDFNPGLSLPNYNAESIVLNASEVFGDINNAESILESGFTSGDAGANKVSKSAIHWLEDEDPEMANATTNVLQAELALGRERLITEKTKLEEFGAKVDQNRANFTSNLEKYSSEVQREATRVNTFIANYQADLQKEIQRVNTEVSKYQSELQKETQKFNGDIASYQAELTKEQANKNIDLQNYTADLNRAVQKYQNELASYTSEIQKEQLRIASDLQVHGAKLNEANIKYQADALKFNSEMTKANAYLQESGIRLQTASAYTQKSRDSVQSSQLFLARAVGELQAVTGAITAPEQQQQSQRREQGATS